MTKRQTKTIVRIILASAFVIALNALQRKTVPHQSTAFTLALYAVPYLVIGYDILRKAAKGIIRAQLFDENFLMAVATLGAFVLGNYSEGVAVMIFYQIGEFFQSYAIGKSRKNIASLMDIRSDYANIRQNGALVRVAPETVSVGTVITVQSGEKIPIDGVIVSGSSNLNTVALTGESMPRAVKEGDEVLSGCINIEGLLQIQTTKPFGESTVSRILDLVENAGSKKAKAEHFISKFSRLYTPIVCACAALLAVIPPVFRALVLSAPCDWSTWVYRALSFLVISCPCALVISIPLSFFAGIGGMSRNGVLVKGSNYIEALSKTKHVVFDKTGTLTEGVFKVEGVHHNRAEAEKIIEYCALIESFSHHPISQSLKDAYAKPIDTTRVTNVTEKPGLGVTGTIDGVAVACGNEKLMQTLTVPYKECHSRGTIVHVAVNGEYFGHIVIADQIKPTAAKTIDELKKLGIKNTVMLTGDNPTTAHDVAKALKIDTVYAALLPQDKVTKVEKLLEKKGKNETLTFVGDGINDAPVLSLSDVGIAMGAIGSDAAIEAADIVLMDDNPAKIAFAIHTAKKCMRIVQENIWFAITIKIAFLALSAAGIGSMWFAIFADVGVMVLAVLNAIRTLAVKKEHA